jgi:hypothetical protein
MRTYENREAAERDPELDLRIIWECDRCHETREELPYCNEGGRCHCGGNWMKAGESHNT